MLINSKDIVAINAENNTLNTKYLEIMILKKFLEELTEGVNLIDIGCSGGLNKKWLPIENYLNLFGFDPNKEECIRLSELKNNFRSVKYLPYAIAGYNGNATLYKTKSMYCTSLLKPDNDWLKRFFFHQLFDVIEEETVKVDCLDGITEFNNLDLDILKIDAQGLELQILQGGEQLINNAFYVETESGFTPNYINESTQSQVDEYMRSKGFLLFDLILYRMPLDNRFKNICKKSQLLWTEAIWLKDYITLFQQNKLKSNDLSREKALKILLLCSIQGCIDYGYELAKIFSKLHLITMEEFSLLEDERNWILPYFLGNTNRLLHQRLLNLFLRLLPTQMRAFIQRESSIAMHQKNIFSSILR